jgi:23S rRNA-intervening sequence protein
MPYSNLLKVRAWSRSCDVAVNVYRVLTDLNDQHFAERVIKNAFTIPEAVAAAFGCLHPAAQDIALNRGLEALAVLQTQLHLAVECGLLPANRLTLLNHDATALAHELRDRTERYALGEG